MIRISREYRPRRFRPILVSLLLLAAAPGCYFGVSSNPFRFPNLPTNDVVRTHAKPGLRGYYHNFDPAAASIEVTPIESVNQVGKQHILIASVCDKNGNGLRNRRVEWHVTGAGHIVEVDESGFFPGRGYLVDDRYAVSYTNYHKHTITRGNDDPSDDIELRPGQTWCVITSREEGDTHVTCYAPGVYDWDKHKVFAVKHWVDACPIFPPCAVNAAGQPHTFTTRVERTSDRSPAGGYRVRYRILDGPPAVLEPGGAAQVEVATDYSGNANVVLRQVQPTPGVNHVQIDVVRPSEKPTGKEFLLASQVVTKTWAAPSLAIQKTAPPQVAVGQTFVYQITVTNSGSSPTQGITVRDTLPQSLELVSSNPLAARQGPNLIWGLGQLMPQQQAAIQFQCVATAPGMIVNWAEAALAEGQVGRASAQTEVVAASLTVSKTGPATALVGQTVSFPITVTNRGAAPAIGVTVTDSFDPGFNHQSGSGPVQMPLGDLAPGESKSLTIELNARLPGRLCNRVVATAAGGLTASAEHCVDVSQPQLEIVKAGPNFAFVGAQVEFTITARNVGSIPAGNLVIQDQIPPELTPQQASDGGLIQGNLVTWNLGALGAGQQRTVSLLAVANRTGTNVCNQAMLAGEGGIAIRSEPACMEIRGVPAILTEVIDRLDPVPVGGETTYTIRVTNQGSVPLNDVTVACRIPAGLEFVGAEGAVNFKYDQRTRSVLFDSFKEAGGGGMAPGKMLIYQVQVKAARPGDYRFDVSTLAKELKSPITKQESTRVYDPNTGEIDQSKNAEPSANPSILPAESRDENLGAPSALTLPGSASPTLLTLPAPKEVKPSSGGGKPFNPSVLIHLIPLPL